MRKEGIKRTIEGYYLDFLSRLKKPTKGVSLAFNVLVKEEKGDFIAHCLELDIVATGQTEIEVENDIASLIVAQVDYAFSNNNLENLFHPAPQEVWREFLSCKDQIERKHRLKSQFSFSEASGVSLPPWIITKTCLAPRACRV